MIAVCLELCKCGLCCQNDRGLNISQQNEDNDLKINWLCKDSDGYSDPMLMHNKTGKILTELERRF